MNFVVIAMARTGSSHLVNLLSAHPDIFCHGNVFASRMMPVFYPKGEEPPPDELSKQKDRLRQLRIDDPRAFVNEVFAAGHGRQHIGFKIFRRQNDEILHELIEDPKIKKIVLFRRNVLANYSSKRVSGNSGRWGVKKGQSIPEAPKVEFNAEDFNEYHDTYVTYYSSIFSRLKECREPFFAINYEELNSMDFLGNLVNFVGADANKQFAMDNLRREQVKQNSSNIISRFSNGEDVEAFLKKYGLEAWGHEAEVSLDVLGQRHV